jgi:hypothetical protein
MSLPALHCFVLICQFIIILLLRLTIASSMLCLRFVQKRLFVDGDDNGDGELSFREFKCIVAKVAPHFSIRTQLKMFRYIH